MHTHAHAHARTAPQGCLARTRPVQERILLDNSDTKPYTSWFTSRFVFNPTIAPISFVLSTKPPPPVPPPPSPCSAAITMSRNAGSIPTPAAPDPDDEYDDDDDGETPGLAAAPLLPGRPHTGGMSESFSSEPSATASYSSYLIFYERMGVVGGGEGG